jgi:hypothetical protein
MPRGYQQGRVSLDRAANELVHLRSKKESYHQKPFTSQTAQKSLSRRCRLKFLDIGIVSLHQKPMLFGGAQALEKKIAFHGTVEHSAG